MTPYEHFHQEANPFTAANLRQGRQLLGRPDLQLLLPAAARVALLPIRLRLRSLARNLQLRQLHDQRGFRHRNHGKTLLVNFAQSPGQNHKKKTAGTLDPTSILDHKA